MAVHSWACRFTFLSFLFLICIIGIIPDQDVLMASVDYDHLLMGLGARGGLMSAWEMEAERGLGWVSSALVTGNKSVWPKSQDAGVIPPSLEAQKI